MYEQIMQGLIKHQINFKQITLYRQRPTSHSQKLALKLHEDYLTISSHKQQITQLAYKDLIGVLTQNLQQNLHVIRVNSFARRARWCRSQRRVVESYQYWLQIKSEELQSLKLQLVRKITNRPINRLDKDTLKLIVYLNPNAGSNSQKHFRRMEEFLSYTNFTFDLVRTTHRNHCKEHLSTIDLNKYEAAIIISGDGLMHEFVNSVACGKLPVSHVPGGSGNAFSKAQTTLAEEECRDEQAMYLVIKGRTRVMNLVKMQLQKEPQPIYSFLSLEWAFLADIDMNSQFLRCLGGLRFQIYSAYRCIALRRYNGRLFYSTKSSQLPPLNQQITEQSFVKMETNFLNTVFCSIPFISDQYEFAPLLKVEQEAIDMQLITQQNGRWQLIKYLLNSSNGNHFDKEKGQPKQGYEFIHSKIKSYRLQPLGEGQQMGLFGIDGERYDAQKMQASMSDKKVITFA